ncbi:MAG: hypothetical protein Q8N63_09100 [Nanoarchaeota archaeon]|nr:hypothetical protein [Nanoarchaeota archaeon]
MGYYIELEGRVLEAIRRANLINYKPLHLFQIKLVPFKLLERASKINLQDKFCNISLQNPWFCLDKKYVYRKFTTGWKKFRVSFSDTYIDNSKRNRKIVSDAYNLCPKPKSKIFSDLCEKHYVAIRGYISGKNKIPLSTFLKSCHLLGFEPWKELDGCKFYSGSSDRSRFIVFKDKISPELYILLNWLILEGNLDISRPTISIYQNVGEHLCFKKLIKLFNEVFEVSPQFIKLQKFKTRPNISSLVVSSAPLRQLLNLRYNIALGYKSREIKPNPFFNFDRENILKILASEIETEGSFARHKKSKIIHCDVSFSTYSKDYSLSVFDEFKRLGYPVNFRTSRRNRFGVCEEEQRVTFWGVFEIQKFAFEIMPYFCHIGKIINLLEVLKQGDFLKITRVDSNEDIKTLIQRAKNKCGSFKLLTQGLNADGLQISHKAVEAWIHQSNNVSVYAILKMCEVVGEKNYFNYLPKELAFSLWIQGFVSRKNAEDIRGIENAYKHVEDLIKYVGDRDRLVP